MIDIHTHVLPGVDDGSESVEESVSMLLSLARQGVTTAVATPHFYATQLEPERFFRHRQRAADRLAVAMSGQRLGIDLLLGAEVLFFEGIAQTEQLPRFCIQGTQLLLLEMPFTPWSERWVREVLTISDRDDITVVLAHVDRYLRYTTPAVFEQMLDCGILFQANADFFERLSTRRTAFGMLREEMIHFLGTDCHNLTTRAPNMAAALDLIGKRLGGGAVERLEEIQRRYF